MDSSSFPKLQQPLLRPEIDGLKAIAVLAVALDHANPGLKGEFVGIDIFFVISGSLITGIVYRSLEENQFSLLVFWERRIRRIFPALIISLVGGRLMDPFYPRTDRSGSHVDCPTAFCSEFLLLAGHRVLCIPGRIEALATHLVIGSRRAVLLSISLSIDFSSQGRALCPPDC